MRATFARLTGFGLVEVLVALAVVAVNALGWTAALQVIFTLVRRVGELTNGLDPAVVASTACALGIIVPRSADSGVEHRRSNAWLRAHRSRSCGVSLVELLVALAVGGIVLAGLAATTAVTGRAARVTTQTLDAATVRAGIPALLREVVETAGRGTPSDCGIATAAGAPRVDVRRALDDGSITDDEIFAGVDGGGRPALYLRRAPHARQPWVEGVTGFSVESIDLVAGRDDGSPRAERLSLRIVHAALDEPLEVAVELPHRPCVEAPP